MSGRYFYASVLGFCFGIATALTVGDALFFGLFLLLLCGALTLALRVYSSGFSRISYLVPLLVCFMALGIIRADAPEFFSNEDPLARFENSDVVLTGKIIDEPDRREGNARIILLAQSVNAGNGRRETSQKVLITAPLYPEWRYGDEIEVRGRPTVPKNFASGQGRVFNYVSYLDKDNIRYEMYQPKISLVSSGRGNPVRAGLFKVKSEFVRALSTVIPEPEIGLLSGILVGTKHALGAEFLEKFRRVGIIHIIVLSGYNLTVVAGFFTSIFFWLPRRVRFIVSAGAIVLFVIMVGAGATAVRAAVMALLVILSGVSYRRYDVSRALTFAGFLMLLHNPKILLYDPSFELSFLATVGLIYGTPIVERWLYWLTPRLKIREITATTIATQITVLPLLLYMTGNFSIVSLPANLLVLPVIPFAMFFGFLSGVLASIWTLLALPFAYITKFLLAYVFMISDMLARLPFAAFEVRAFPFWVVICVYAGLFFGVLKLSKRKEALSAGLRTAPY